MPGQSSGPIGVCVVSKSPLLEPRRSRHQNSSTRYLFSVETHKNASRVGPMQPAETHFCVDIYVQYIYSRHTQIPEKGDQSRATHDGLTSRRTGRVSICNACCSALQRSPLLGSPCQILGGVQLEDPGVAAAAAAAETRRLLEPALVHLVCICHFAAAPEQE